MKVLAPVRPEERRAVALAFTALFGIIAAHTLLETARDALFLARLPAARLAWVYLAVAALSLALFALQARAAQARGTRAALVAWLLAAAGVNAAFGAAAARPGAWVAYTLYLWSGVFATLVVLRFWTLVGDLFTVGQAKRLFALIGSGSVLGAIAGAALASVLSGGMDPGGLLLSAAVVLVATAVGPVVFLPRAPEEPAAVDRRAAADLIGTARLVRDRPYLNFVALLVLVSTGAFTLVDYLFKAQVAAHVAAADLSGFFARAALVFNALSLVVQVVGVGWLVRTQSIERVLAFLPALLGVGSLAVVGAGGLGTALALKGCDGALRNSLHRTAVEVLFVPLPAAWRGRVKGLVDVLGQRGGQALASGLIFLLASQAVAWLAACIAFACVAWIALAHRLKRHYVDLFRTTLSEVAVRTRFEHPELDLASLEALIAGLNSAHDSEVLAALDLLAEQDRMRLVPALLLYHPSPAIVVHALELFAAAGREDIVPITDRLLDHIDPEVRAATLRARAWLAPSPELYARFADDPSPIVGATAQVGLVSYGGADASAAQARMRAAASAGTLAERIALARAIRSSPGAGYDSVLVELATVPEARVRREVVRAMREIRSARFIAPAIAMLSDQSLRHEARATLVAIGPDALTRLDAALADPALPSELRRQLPRAIGQFGGAAAADTLMQHLKKEPEGAVRYRILRTLVRLRDDDPGLPLDDGVLEASLAAALQSVFRLLAWKVELAECTHAMPARRTPVQELVAALLDHKELQALERVFLFLGLLHPDEDLRSVQRGLRSAKRTVRASSVELLQNILEPPLRAPILALVDDVPDAVRWAQAAGGAARPRLDYEDLLSELLQRGGLGMRSLVAYHVGELQLHGLRDAIAGLRTDAGGLLGPIVERTLQRLEAPRAAEG